MSNKQYYRGIEELEQNPELPKSTQEEFPQEVPVLDYLNDSLKKEKSSRRDFLKTMGFSVSAAALAASCDIPVKKAIPYVFKPEEITPGKALYYASTFFDGRDYASILVKTREGRPIKVDGNSDSPLTKGGSTAAIQASVLSLYDHNRYAGPMANGEEISWEQADQDVKAALSAGGRKVLLTSSIISPSLKQAIAGLQSSYGVEHITYDALSASAMLTANEKSFGKKAIPSYKFGNADVIVSFGADFLGNWLSGLQYSTDYAKKRKVGEDNPTLSKHYQVESYLSLSGSNADVRVGLKPSQLKAALFQLHNALAGKMGGASISGVPGDDIGNGEIARMAESLAAARGKSLVICGSSDEDCQLVTNAINSMLGSYGSTIDFNRTLNTRQGDDADFIRLVNDLESGAISTLMTYNVNPAFDSAIAEQFISGLGKTNHVIAFDHAPNETNALAKHILPDNHYLESWGDAEPVTGSFSIAQPTIQPLFNTRSFGDSLLALAGEEKSFYDFMKETWTTNFGGLGDFQTFWDDAVRNGFYQQESVPVQELSGAGASASGVSYSAPESSAVELVLFADKLGAGAHASNPYMQELPDPVSKVAWGNYAAISKALGEELDVASRDRNERPGKKRLWMINVTANGKTIELPALIQPGIPKGVVAVPVGYGRTVAGLTGTGVGANGFPLANSTGSTFNYEGIAATVSKTGNMDRVAQTQLHHTIDDDRPVVKETTLDDYKENLESGNFDRYLSEFRDLVDISLYPERKSPGHKWGMNIDLNSCTGCGACVVACNVENNIPVVGKEEVANGREMHWLRIDRYYASSNPEEDNLENPSVVFMPMMCQHCDNAPCENVCPVNATNHSTEGLNQMAYNRCIGTRYCANNCPFKVRRFNWFDYWGADSFGPKNDLDHGKEGKVAEEMRHDLSRMILNPDVTVRSRGVIEKCSFCVQRIQEHKLDAKIKGQPLETNAIKTACQSACPADAIVFGDTNDANSTVTKLNAAKRNYYVLEEIHVLPSVGYLTKVSNTDKAYFDQLPNGHFGHAGQGSHGEPHGGGHGEDKGHGGDDHGKKEEHGSGH